MITTVLRLYAEKVLEAVAEFDHFIRVSNLEVHREAILRQLQETPPATAKESAATIQKLTGIRRGVTRTKVFLRKLDFRPRKRAGVPAKANVEAQEEFKKNCGTKVGGGKRREKAGILRRRSPLYSRGILVHVLVNTAIPSLTPERRF